jgi:hypothetical protein
MRNAVYDRFSISTGRERTELAGGKGVLMNTSTLAWMCKSKNSYFSFNIRDVIRPYGRNGFTEG